MKGAAEKKSSLIMWVDRLCATGKARSLDMHAALKEDKPALAFHGVIATFEESPNCGDFIMDNDTLVNEIFHEVAELPHDQRDEILQQRLKGEPKEVANEVELLLQMHDMLASGSDSASIMLHTIDSDDELFDEADGFAQYEIIEFLSRGGMGVVYHARHRTLKREVAIKVLPKRKGPKTREAEARFLREAELLGKMNHPNVVQAYDSADIEGRLYLVMEFVAGEDLSKYVGRKGQVNVEDAIDCIQQSAEGLAYAHEQGVVHRDVKPGNLLRRHDGVVKVADLGLGRFNSETTTGLHSLTLNDQIMGTIDYMSPEQTLGAGQVDHRTDIYSLGGTLYFLLTGKSLYGHITLVHRRAAHRLEPIPDIQDLRPDTPDWLKKVFEKMVAKKPSQRYQSMHEVVEALSNTKTQSTSVKKRVEGFARTHRRMLVLSIIFVVVAIACMAIAVRLFWGMNSDFAADVETAELVKNLQGSFEFQKVSPNDAPQQWSPGQPLPTGYYRITGIDLSGKSWQGDRLKPLANLTHVRRFVANHSSIQPTELTHLPMSKMEDLQLNDCERLADDSLSGLAASSTLASLQLASNQPGEKTIDAIVDRFSSLRTLILDGCDFNKKQLARLGDLPSLRTLSLSGAAITDNNLRHLQEPLRSLDIVILSDNPITGSGLATLTGDYDNRPELVLDRTRVSKQELEKWLPKLNGLRLSVKPGDFISQKEVEDLEEAFPTKVNAKPSL